MEQWQLLLYKDCELNIITAIKNIMKRREVVINIPPMFDIKNALFPVVLLPFNGEKIPFTLKELNEVEIKSCGDFSLIENMSSNIDIHEPKIEEIVEFSEIQHNICKISMISPSYNDVLSIFDKNETIKNAKEELKEIEFKLAKLELENNKKEYRELHTYYSSVKILANLILPNDFTASVTEYALGIHKSDIKKVTYEMLLNSAILAEKGHDSPHDHLSGQFSDFNKSDIDNCAWMALAKERERLSNGRG